MPSPDQPPATHGTTGITCVVQARMGSTRLPGKVLAHLGERPMLEFLLERLRGSAFDTLVVATSDLPRDDDVVAVARRAGAEVVRGPEADVLGRFRMALDAFPGHTVVRVTGDCPFVDPRLVDATVRLHQDRAADYTSNVLPRTFPKGLDVEVASAEALLIADAEAVDNAEREHVTPFLYRHPERFRLSNLRCPDDVGDLSDERWTVDTPEDLVFARAVVARMAPDVRFGWQEILEAMGRRAPSPPDQVRLRTARADDAQLLLAWRNDPDAVRFSCSGQAVAVEEHARWYPARLEDPAARIWIAQVDRAIVGFIRVNVRAAEGVVSIGVAPEWRGRGVSSELIGALQAKVEGDFQVVRLVALVHPANAASVRAFERCGFSAVGEDDGFIRFEWNQTRSSKPRRTLEEPAR